MQEFAALLLLLLLLCPTARGEEGPVTRGGFVSALWESAGAVPYDAPTPVSDVSPRWAALLEWDTFLPDGVAACNDYQDISPWADDSLYWACDAGVLPWSPGGRLDPSGTLTQAQTADIFSAFARQGRPG